MRYGNGQLAKLIYGEYVIMENRSGLCVDILITDSTHAVRSAARQLLTRARRRHIHPEMLSADKGYYVKEFRSLNSRRWRPRNINSLAVGLSVSTSMNCPS